MPIIIKLLSKFTLKTEFSVSLDREACTAWNMPSVALICLMVLIISKLLILLMISSISHFFIIASRAYSAKYVPVLNTYYISDSTSHKKWKHLIRFWPLITTQNWIVNAIHSHIRSAFTIFLILNGTNCRWWLIILLLMPIQQTNRVLMELSLLSLKVM